MPDTMQMKSPKHCSAHPRRNSVRESCATPPPLLYRYTALANNSNHTPWLHMMQGLMHTLRHGLMHTHPAAAL